MKIPFWIYALNKNYSGKEYEIEKVKYYYTGREMELKINSIKYAPDTFEYELGLNQIDRKYGNFPEEDYDLEEAKILKKYKKIKDKDYLLAEAKYELKKGIISDLEYDIKNAELTIDDEVDLALKINEIEFMHGTKSKYDFDTSKINITFPNHDSKEYKLAILNINKQYNKISEYEYEKEFLKLTCDEDDLGKQLLNLEKKYNKISEHEYEKKMCTENNEPYFSVVSEKYNEGKIEFELDWNEIFIKKLKEEGYEGYTDQQMVDLYFKEICKQVAEEEEIFDYTEQFGPSIKKEEYDGDDIAYS